MSRAFCSVDEAGYLVTARDVSRIEKHGVGARYTEDGEHWEHQPGPGANSGGTPSPDGDAPPQRFVLIIDQFEEIITTHPERWRERADFFRQLDQAMRDDPNLWVVLGLLR